jgi:hypothetical protein
MSLKFSPEDLISELTGSKGKKESSIQTRWGATSLLKEAPTK